MANSVDPDQTAPKRAVSSGSTLFASILLKFVSNEGVIKDGGSSGRRFRATVIFGY